MRERDCEKRDGWEIWRGRRSAGQCAKITKILPKCKFFDFALFSQQPNAGSQENYEFWW